MSSWSLIQASYTRAVNHFSRSAARRWKSAIPTPDERPRILVVEPNRTNLGVIARRLAEAGYRVTTADSGASAIAELYRLPIDLVLAELNMPRMSGAELARAIRGEVQWNDIPVMLITGKSEPKGAVRAYEAGADDVILKPFHFEVLVARIERRIERARSVQAAAGRQCRARRAGGRARDPDRRIAGAVATT